MKFGIIKERKNPPDRRVVFTPDEILTFKSLFPKITVSLGCVSIRGFFIPQPHVFMLYNIKKSFISKFSCIPIVKIICVY